MYPIGDEGWAQIHAVVRKVQISYDLCPRCFSDLSTKFFQDGTKPQNAWYEMRTVFAEGASRAD